MAETEGGLDKVAEVLSWRDSKLFSESERVALDYAEAVTYSDRQVDDVLFGEVQKHLKRLAILFV